MKNKLQFKKTSIFWSFAFLLLLNSYFSFGQVGLTNAANTAAINFSSTVSGVSNGAYTAAGFQATPSAGQLDSDAWAVTGWSEGSLAFGGSNTTGDYARGTASAAVGTGGFYAYAGSPGSTSNPSLMIQPGGSDFAPGTLTLRIRNNGASNITQLVVSYNIFVRNDQARSNSFNFSHSTDNSSYTNVAALDYTTTAVADALGWVQVGTSPSRSTTITGLNVAPNAFIYLRWSSADVAGGGSRDEIGLDDISLNATFASLVTAPTVTTPTVASITTTSATLGATVTSDGGAALSARGTVWGTSALPTTNVLVEGGTTTGAFNHARTGFAVNTQYFYRGYATNAQGTTYSPDGSFYTLANIPNAPLVGSPTTTELNVTIGSGDGNPATTEYAIRVNAGQYVQSNGSLNSTEVWQTAAVWGTKAVTGLMPSTSYSFDVKARNGALVETGFGTTTVGTTISASAPLLDAGPLTAFGNVCLTSEGTGSFTLDGSNLTSADVIVNGLSGFTILDPSTSTYQNSVSFPSSAFSSTVTVQVKFTPVLVQSYSGFIVINGGGVTSDVNVAVSGAGINTPVTVTTGTSSAITATGATLAGSFVQGCSAVTASGIQYSTDLSFSNLAAFSTPIMGLAANTTYNYRAFATDATGTVFGANGSFTTLQLSAPTASAATAIETTSFIANWGAVSGADHYRLDVSAYPIFGVLSSGATITETFTNIQGGSAGSYLTRTWTGNGGISWTANKSRVDQVVFTGNDAITLRDEAGADITSGVITGGVSSITFDVKQVFSGSGGVLTVKVLSGPSFGTVTTVGTIAYSTTASQFVSSPFSISGDYKIVLENNTSARPAIDNLSFTGPDFTNPSFVTGTEVYNNLLVNGTSKVVSGLQSGKTYYYRVRAESTNSTSINSNFITVTTPVLIDFLYASSYCGLTSDTVNPTFYSTTPTVTEGSTLSYRFKITNTITNTTVIIDRTVPNANLLLTSIAAYNTLYTAQVAAVINGVEQPYSVVCSVTTPALPLNKVVSTQCGTTLAALNSTINVATITGAQNYRFRVSLASNPGVSEEVVSAFPSFRLTSLTTIPLNFGNIYNVEVQSDVVNNGVAATTSYGDVCAMTTPSVASISATPNLCGTTLPEINSRIYVNSVPNAIQYTYRVSLATVPATFYTFATPFTNFRLTSVPGLPLQFGTTYNVAVSVRVNIGGMNVDSGFGDTVCQYTTPIGPTTQIQTAQCGGVSFYQVPANSTSIVADFVSGASYRFKLENLSLDVPYTQTISRPVNNFALSMFTGLTDGTIYTVSVALDYFGSGDFGKDCTIRTPEAPGVIARVIDTPFSAIAYPNPFSSSFTLAVSTKSSAAISVKVYDMIGRLIEERTSKVTELETSTIGNNYPAGVYNVLVTQDSETNTIRMIKR